MTLTFKSQAFKTTNKINVTQTNFFIKTNERSNNGKLKIAVSMVKIILITYGL